MADAPNREQTIRPLVTCPECGNSVRKDKIVRHLVKVHSKLLAPPAPAQVIPVGQRVLSGLERNERWTANRADRCLGCRRPVVYLNMGNNKEKAFDITATRTILGTHICEEPRSQSIYAYQGGIIDSNRRKH